MIFIFLFIILAAVLILPFSVKKIEEQLEIFLFIAGLMAVTVTSQWSTALIKEAFYEPIKITIAVLLAGLLFRELKNHLNKYINKAARFIGLRRFSFLLVLLLGFFSSVITAIIAALVLVEVISHLNLDKKHEVRLVIISCFSIGLGAALTPIGEPLSTIAISKLKDFPFFADFWFMLKSFWAYIIPGILILSGIGYFIGGSHLSEHAGLKETGRESLKDIIFRTLKVYLFVMGLIFLGTGFEPLIDTYVTKIAPYILYWINIISAILDNATLTAAEIDPALSLFQIKAAILGLIIAGGMLIPGNIPNIIAANKLGIKSKEWAKFGIPLGLVLMVIFFFVLIVLK